jgi:hypothetical protein
MTGAFVCAALSIVPTVRHADYLLAFRDSDDAAQHALAA